MLETTGARDAHFLDLPSCRSFPILKCVRTRIVTHDASI